MKKNLKPTAVRPVEETNLRATAGGGDGWAWFLGAGTVGMVAGAAWNAVAYELLRRQELNRTYEA